VRVLRASEVEQRVGLSRTTIWRLERTGEFPSRRRLGANAVGWLEQEVEDWITSRPEVSAGSLPEVRADQ
jgi:predicted DNA-binding transcriptional regulator AlpA